MLEINDLCTIAVDDGSSILNGLNIKINKGETHVIMGPNGSGKSTLANTILANPRYKVIKGDIKFEDESILKMKTDERARKGIFMSFQNPFDVPGVKVGSFLKTIKSIYGKVNLYTFSKEVEDNMQKLNMDKSYIERDVNVGFSGGEKKKNEILQLLTVNPKLAILDETDSGLDVDAIKVLKDGINLYKNDSNAILIITHNINILEGLKVDYVHVLVDGKIVCTGDINLAMDIAKNGYKKYLGDL